MPEPLPIYEIENGILSSLRRSRRLILSAPTGSGKSTQVPQILLKHGLLKDGQAIILQPRRLAARLLAARVAEELNTQLGRLVGYQIRFDNLAGPETKIKFVTEGILLRQMLQDPKLRGAQALIFDEFHERHLHGDITLARALELQEKERPDLLLIVMSATLDSALLEHYLKPCEILHSQGRTFPVTIQYAETPGYLETRPAWDLAADAFGEHIGAGGQGDALIFMPGGYEIQRTIEALGRRPESRGFTLLPLHGELAPKEQDAAVARHRQPKVVVATNVAETSLTIDGIRLVIDSGLARIPRYDPYRGINTLLVEKISRASADQRAGRAGRTAPGHCIRLWTEKEHSERIAHELPEVKRIDLAEVILSIKAAGVTDLGKFRWLEAPSQRGLEHAEELLADLGAVDKQGRITELGRRMLAFPLHPRYARMLLAAHDYGCVRQAAFVVALTQGRDLLLRNNEPAAAFRESLSEDETGSDFFVLMRAWEHAERCNFHPETCQKAGIHALTARQIGPLREQFLRIAEREGMDIKSTVLKRDALRKCLLAGFADRLARRLDENSPRCELVHGRRGTLARESVVRGALLVAAEAREVEGKDRAVNTVLALATAIEPAWLKELFPDELETLSEVRLDPATKRVYAEEQILFRGLRLESRRVEPPPAEAAARLLAREIREGRLAVEQWDEDLEQWILRLNQLSQWCPELALPPIMEQDRNHLIEEICQGALSCKDIRERDAKAIVRSWLSHAQQELVEKHAPERLKLPNGRNPKVNYTREGLPWVAARIQDFYDVEATPRIAMNRVAVVLHILAPNMRAVQITQDLAGFWREHYPKLKQQLQRRYPKHKWR